MEYSKQFDYEGITILFDTLAISKEYPTFYIATRKGNHKVSAFIPKRKLKCTGVLKVSDNYSVVSFTFNEQ